MKKLEKYNSILFILRWVMVLLILSVMSYKLVKVYDKVNRLETIMEVRNES